MESSLLWGGFRGALANADHDEIAQRLLRQGSLASVASEDGSADLAELEAMDAAADELRELRERLAAGHVLTTLELRMIEDAERAEQHGNQLWGVIREEVLLASEEVDAYFAALDAQLDENERARQGRGGDVFLQTIKDAMSHSVIVGASDGAGVAGGSAAQAATAAGQMTTSPSPQDSPSAPSAPSAPAAVTSAPAAVTSAPAAVTSAATTTVGTPAAASPPVALPETAKDRATRIWRAIDVDGSGYIQRDELLRHVMATGVDQMTADRVFAAIDTNHDGQIELSEWLAVYAADSLLDKAAEALAPRAAPASSAAQAPSLVQGEEVQVISPASYAAPVAPTPVAPTPVAAAPVAAAPVAPTPVAAAPVAAADSASESAEHASSMQEQLKAALAAQHGRVIDLFRAWDRSGDGRISKVELRRAFLALGYDAPRADVDALFDALDVDRSGALEYRELYRALRQGVELAPNLMPGGAGPVELHAQLYSKEKAQGQQLSAAEAEAKAARAEAQMARAACAAAEARAAAAEANVMAEKARADAAESSAAALAAERDAAVAAAAQHQQAAQEVEGALKLMSEFEARAKMAERLLAESQAAAGQATATSTAATAAPAASLQPAAAQQAPAPLAAQPLEANTSPSAPSAAPVAAMPTPPTAAASGSAPPLIEDGVPGAADVAESARGAAAAATAAAAAAAQSAAAAAAAAEKVAMVAAGALENSRAASPVPSVRSGRGGKAKGGKKITPRKSPAKGKSAAKGATPARGGSPSKGASKTSSPAKDASPSKGEAAAKGSRKGTNDGDVGERLRAKAKAPSASKTDKT